MAAGDLTDLATAKIAADISATAVGDTDTILGTLITAISAYVPQVLGRGILADTYVETYQGNGKQSMLLRQRPIIAISSIAWQGRTITTAGDPIAGTAGIWTDGRSAFLEADGFPLNMPIRIAYSAGYVTVPADISLAVAELVAEAYGRRVHSGETSRSQGAQVTVAFDTRKMHAAIADKLASYMLGAPC